MPATVKTLPFDERNERDFEEMTDRIRSGLESIRKSNSLKATQDSLARLAHCSRRTLNLRRWPIDELKRIKVQRQTLHQESKKEAAHKNRSTTLEKEKQLIKQIRNYQEQNGRLFDRVQILEEGHTASAVIRTALEREIDSLRPKGHKTIEGCNQQVNSEDSSKVLKVVG